MKRNNLAASAILFSCLLVGVEAKAQPTKDQVAYNYIFDRLNILFPDTQTEDIHLLSVLVPATWVALDDSEADAELQSIAGAIPEDQFSLDPSRMKLRLDQLYSAYITQVELPALSPEAEANLQRAREEYTTASVELAEVTQQYNTLWDAHVVRLRSEGKPITGTERRRFRAQHGGKFTAVNGKLTNAMARIGRYSDSSDRWRQAAVLLNNEVGGVMADGSGIYAYRGGQASLRSISADCLDDDPKGWEGLTFNSNTESQKFRSSSWNGNGGWSGGFFGISGSAGRSNYENIVNTASDSVSLQFCNLIYIRFEPGPWFDVSFLQAIDSGVLKLKPGALNYGKPVFGKRGVIPHLVKGAIVARRVKFLAQSDATTLREVQSVSGGGGGFRIGGWGFGGSASRVKFDREYNSTSGSYGRSTNSSVPVIVAIVTEPTKGSGDLPAPEEAAAPASPEAN